MLRTNYEALIHLLAPQASVFGEQHCDFSLHVQVDRGAGSAEPAFFRGMGHLVTARYGENLFLFDLRRREVHAWISRSVAENRGLWEHRFFPLMLGVLGCTVGILPLHSACVAKQGRGIFIAGESMAGKSTLAVALAKEHFALLSDDWTYVRWQDGRFTAHGLKAPIKLLPDAVANFPELRALSTCRTSNGEIAYEISAREFPQMRVISTCTPELFLFLERTPVGGDAMIPASSSFVREYINNSVDRLPGELWDSVRRRERMIERLSELPSWRFRYSGSPQAGARFIKQFLSNRKRSHDCSPQSSS